MAKKGSRLTRSLEHQSKKQLYIFTASTVLILTILGIFSTKILDTIGSIMIGGDQQNEIVEESIDPITPPRFTTIPSATENGNIRISGTVSKENGTLELYVNNKKVITEEVGNSKKFNIEKITVTEGENLLKGKYILNGRESAFTKDYRVLYSKDEPKIEDISPGDGTEFKRGDQEIEITGKTQANNTVTVNDFRAVVDEKGSFSYYLRLNEGDNKITIKALSPTGKETIKELNFKYSP